MLAKTFICLCPCPVRAAAYRGACPSILKWPVRPLRRWWRDDADPWYRGPCLVLQAAYEVDLTVVVVLMGYQVSKRYSQRELRIRSIRGDVQPVLRRLGNGCQRPLVHGLQVVDENAQFGNR